MWIKAILHDNINHMELITAPAETPTNIDLFLAGGITNCPDWQKEISTYLNHLNITVANPRRVEVFKPEDEAAQISWEYHALKKTKAILFWFPEETLCPITLFELGKFTMRKDIPVFVGTHPNYKRKNDVYYQLLLERPEIEVVHTIHELGLQVQQNFRN